MDQDRIERMKKLVRIPYERVGKPQKLGQRQGFMDGARLDELYQGLDEAMEKIKEIEKGIREF